MEEEREGGRRGAEGKEGRKEGGEEGRREGEMKDGRKRQKEESKQGMEEKVNGWVRNFAPRDQNSKVGLGLTLSGSELCSERADLGSPFDSVKSIAHTVLTTHPPRRKSSRLNCRSSWQNSTRNRPELEYRRAFSFRGFRMSSVLNFLGHRMGNKVEFILCLRALLSRIQNG